MTPQLILTRITSPLGVTFGRLEIGGPVYKIYATLEPSPPIIPAGHFPLKFEYSRKFGRELWELKNVPGHTELKIHHGNTHLDTEGCILLGLKHSWLGGLPAVLSSRRALESFIAARSPRQNETLELEVIDG